MALGRNWLWNFCGGCCGLGRCVSADPFQLGAHLFQGLSRRRSFVRPFDVFTCGLRLGRAGPLTCFRGGARGLFSFCPSHRRGRFGDVLVLLGLACMALGRDSQLVCLDKLHQRRETLSPGAEAVTVFDKVMLGHRGHHGQHRRWLCAEPFSSSDRSHSGVFGQSRPRVAVEVFDVLQCGCHGRRRLLSATIRLVVADSSSATGGGAG